MGGGVMGDKASAVRFFWQLEKFSERWAQQELGRALRVPHGGAKPDQPWRGAVLHFTADEEIERVIRWFMHEASAVSAHVVVNDRKLGCHDALCDGLELVRRLPVTVVQCRHPGEGAWHARWANDRCYGIECVSAGALRANDEGVLCSWRPRDGSAPEWSTPWASPYKDAVELFGRQWVRYVPEQLEAVVTVLRHLKAIGEPICLPSRPWVIGHSSVQQNKVDPGPDFPIHEVRAAVWDDWRPLSDYDWWGAYQADPRWGKTWRDAAVVAAVRHFAATGKGDREPSVKTAWVRARSAWAALPDNWRGQESMGWIKLALHLLGYAVTSFGAGNFADVTLNTDDHTSIGIFQRAMGLQCDSIAGPVTARALNLRLQALLGVV